MSYVLNALDASFDFPDGPGLDQFKRDGGKVVYSYLTGYQSGKEWTVTRLRMVHSRGLGAVMGFETTAGRPKGGRANGLVDGAAAWRSIEALISGVGYAPKSKLHVVFNADYDTTSADYPTVDAYLMGCAEAFLAAHANADQALYGEYDLVVHTAKMHTSHAEFQTYAWSNQQVYADAEMYQWSNNHPKYGGTIDYDQVFDEAGLGAWWPPGHPLDKPETPVVSDPLEVILSWFKDAATYLNSVQRAAGTGVLWGNIPLKGVVINGVPAKDNTFRTVVRVMFSWVGNTNAGVQRVEKDLAAISAAQKAQTLQMQQLTLAVQKLSAVPPVVKAAERREVD